MQVEDHTPFRRAMAALRSRQPDLEVVAQAGSREETRRNAASVGVAVAVREVGLPDGDGVDVILDLRRAG
jgi:DNA-binding NarL/FixJ family response regulator